MAGRLIRRLPAPEAGGGVAKPPSVWFSSSMAHLAVKLTPGAAADHIDGWGLDLEGRLVLKVRVRARPIEGEANEALI